MSKREMIDAIRRQNPTADEEFLTGFDPRVLEIYLQRLTQLHGRRGRDSVWVRCGDTPAIIERSN